MYFFMNYAPWLKIFVSLITLILQKIFNWNLAYIFIGTRHILLSRPRTPDTFIHELCPLVLSFYSKSDNFNTMKLKLVTRPVSFKRSITLDAIIHELCPLITCLIKKVNNPWCNYSWIMSLEYSFSKSNNLNIMKSIAMKLSIHNHWP